LSANRSVKAYQGIGCFLGLVRKFLQDRDIVPIG
jgi:hypothetical protein